MELTLDPNPSHFLIQHVQAGEIKLNQQCYQQSLIITPEQLFTQKLPEHFDALETTHFEFLLSLKPNIVLLGTGAQHHHLKPAHQHILLQHQIGIESRTTAAASRTFNALAAEGRNVCAALLIP